MRCVREKETAPALICHSRLSSSSLASCEHGMLRASRYVLHNVFLLGFSFFFILPSHNIIASTQHVQCVYIASFGVAFHILAQTATEHQIDNDHDGNELEKATLNAMDMLSVPSFHRWWWDVWVCARAQPACRCGCLSLLARNERSAHIKRQ